jgi:hypothetical protein
VVSDLAGSFTVDLNCKSDQRTKSNLSASQILGVTAG